MALRTFNVVMTCEVDDELDDDGNPYPLPDERRVQAALEYSTAREALSEATESSVSLRLA